MIRDVLFDFDGVLADTEPCHFEAFRKLLSVCGIKLTREHYYEKYLGLDDRACFRAVFRDFKKSLSEEREEELVDQKNGELLRLISEGNLIVPAAAEAVSFLKGKAYLAIVSGALRSEIEAALRRAGIFDSFHTLVGAEDVSEGKPSPEGILQAIKLLNRDHIPESEILLPAECLFVEDSPWGIEAAKRAGVPCLAITSSYPENRLKGANWVIKKPEEMIPFFEFILTPQNSRGLSE